MKSSALKTDRSNRIAEILKDETPHTGKAIHVLYTPLEVLDAARAADEPAELESDSKAASNTGRA